MADLLTPTGVIIVQSCLASVRELQSGKGLSVQICSLGSQESLCQSCKKLHLKKMRYKDFKFDISKALIKFYLLNYLLELEAQQGVQNDRNQHIMLDG